MLAPEGNVAKSHHRTGTARFAKNCYMKNVVLFEENSILPLPERLEASGVKSVWGEVSQESLKNL